MSKNKKIKPLKTKEENFQSKSDFAGEKIEGEENTSKEQKENRSTGGVLWAFFLIFIGTLFLLSNFGVVPWWGWGSLWKFWPLFIIFAGIQLIIGRSRILNLVLGCLTFLILSLIITIVISINNNSFRDWFRNNLNVDLEQSVNIKVPLEVQETITIKRDDYEDIEKREVSIDVTAGEFTLTEDDTNNYFRVDAEYSEGHGKPVVKTEKRDDTLEIGFDTEDEIFWSFPFRNSSKRKYDFILGNPEVLTDLKFNMTAGVGDIDFDSLRINNFQIEMTAGDLDIDLGRQSVPEIMSIELTAGDLNLYFPEDIGIKVMYKITAGSLEIDGETFDGVNRKGTYETRNYDRMSKTLEINVEMTAGDINIKMDK
ncbi:DUF4097 family beta strand repeat protein [Candidatus Dojkabacteria bacterium]|nr:DUF4097 family beta strand repeat protein [Candidatus Dojkabacteria bacterium]